MRSGSALATIVALVVMLILSGSAAFAQTEPKRSPFGITTPSNPPASVPVQPRAGIGGAAQWLLDVQHDLHQRLASAVKAIGADRPVNATIFLVVISFAYGIFHAAGPGHGKAVIASYVLANERTVRRGVQLSFLAALFQALSALVLVAALGLMFNVTGMKRRLAEAWIETAGWGLVAVMGAWLLYGQVRRILRRRAQAGHATAHQPDHQHDNHHHHAHSHHQSHGHASDHVHDDSCDHVHMPAPQQLEGEWSWRRAVAMAFAVGIRPCTGAIVVLVFALSQGLLWAGVLSTFAMALGTAITVSVLAALAIGSRELAVRIAGRRSGRWAGHLRDAAGVLGAGAVLVMGIVLFAGSLAGPSPF